MAGGGDGGLDDEDVAAGVDGDRGELLGVGGSAGDGADGATFLDLANPAPLLDETQLLVEGNCVCGDCDQRAINANGNDPWTDSESDDGDNPVFIDEMKCWRR